MKVEFVYDRDCPNVDPTRVRLLEALSAVGLSLRWQEWRRDDEKSPEYARHCGSPTILVDGRDIVTSSDVVGRGACRLYADSFGRTSGVPALQDIEAALLKAKWTDVAGVDPVKRTLPTLPVVGVALLPKLTCAACWPAYAAILSSLGVSFVDYTPYLLPLTAAFLALTLVMLAYRAASRRGYAPLALGSVASAIVLIGKFAFDSDVALYGGIALLVGASLWNAWPVASRADCRTCSPDTR